MRVFRLLVASFLAGMCSVALAVPVTLTMDDLPTQPVDGLAHPTGVSFGVNTISPGSPVRYGVSAVGTTAFIDGPSIEGSSFVILSLDFDDPTDIFEFSYVRQTNDTVMNAVGVQLFDMANALIGSFSLNASDQGFGWAEGQFVYSGAAISRALLDFSNPSSTGLSGTRFAVDNVVFDSQVPEPGTLVLLLLGLAGIGARHLRA